MKRRFQWSLAGLLLVAGAYAGAQEAAEAVAKAGSLPAGVSCVKANPDGTFKSLVVKATVDADVGGGKGRAAKEARNDARDKCMSHLADWIKQNCEVLVSPEGYPTLVTKGEAVKDAAGAAVQLKKAAGKEFTAPPGAPERVASLVSRQLVVLHSERAEASGQQTYVMGLSQAQLDSPGILKNTSENDGERQDRRNRLSSDGPPRSLEEDANRNPAAVSGAKQASQPAVVKGSKNLADSL
ncbi:MAG: hypothetical protein IT364_17130 [Candidatus Hydrogenedentes bacterium]|nr:hypothetical protein [Candidatus Hydrogenedentota bacterium]